MISLTPKLLALAASLSLVNASPAIKFEFQRRKMSGMKFSAEVPSLPTYSVGAGAEDVKNSNDLLYIINLNICGQDIPVQLDTGSTDLWVKPPTPLKGVETTKYKTKIVYGIGSVTGDVCLCPVSLDKYSIPKQAFLKETSSDFDNLYGHKTYGILGLGFDNLSNINGVVLKDDKSATWQHSVLTNLFFANPKTPNFVSFLLDRASDLDTVSEGSFTVGETEPEYASVIKQPALPVYPEKGYSRWNLVLDSINVNGKAISLTSRVKGAPTGKTIALLDTGASLVLGPKAAIDAIYSAIPGSYYSAADKAWFSPCTAAVLVEFVFGGVKYAVHPLDLTIVTDAAGMKGTVCMAAFREFDLAAGATELDWLLGDSFLRNVYSMYDFGDLDTSTGGLVGHPFIKLLPLPTSEYKAASAEFASARKATLAKLPAELPLSQVAGLVSAQEVTAGAHAGDPNTLAADASDASVVNDLHDYFDKLNKYTPYVLGVLGGMTLILLILLITSIVTCVRQGKGRTYTPITH